MYIVEGNIGVGKSTFLRLIKEQIPDTVVACEPLQRWDDVNSTQSLLMHFYQDPQRWAYTFEVLTLMSRVQEQITLQTQKNTHLFVERSIYSGYYCFAQNGFKQGFLSPVEWHMYSQLFNFLITNKCVTPRGFIYLRINPEIAFERLKKRNRNAENSISLEYLQQIHAQHESLFIKQRDHMLHIEHVPVLVLNCDDDFEANDAQLALHCKAIKEFLLKTQPTFQPARYSTFSQSI